MERSIEGPEYWDLVQDPTFFFRAQSQGRLALSRSAVALCPAGFRLLLQTDHPRSLLVLHPAPVHHDHVHLYLRGVGNIPVDGLPKPLFYLAGITTWNDFSDCITKTSTVFKDNANIFGKVYFPRLLFSAAQPGPVQPDPVCGPAYSFPDRDGLVWLGGEGQSFSSIRLSPLVPGGRLSDGVAGVGLPG